MLKAMKDELKQRIIAAITDDGGDFHTKADLLLFLAGKFPDVSLKELGEIIHEKWEG